MYKNSKYLHALLLTLCCVFVVKSDSPYSVDSKNEQAINWLRDSLRDLITMDYMKCDIYLNRWLQAKKFDQKEARRALQKTLEWRKNNHIDSFPFRDLSALYEQYPIEFDQIRDKSGKPITLISFKSWDIRSKAVTGKLHEVMDQVIILEEKSAQVSYNVTGDPTGILVIDMKGFHALKHGCLTCIPLYFDSIRQHELHYPYNFQKIIIVNAPELFVSIFNQLLPLMTGATANAFHLFGPNEKLWTKFLLETISEENLPFKAVK